MFQKSFLNENRKAEGSKLYGGGDRTVSGKSDFNISFSAVYTDSLVFWENIFCFGTWGYKNKLVVMLAYWHSKNVC